MQFIDPDDELSPVMFLKELPEAPLSDFERLGVTGRYAEHEVAKNKCGVEARYVRVITELREHVSYPMRAYLLMSGPYFEVTDWDNDSGARMVTASAAVAGHITVACKAMPLMMCNPIEIGLPGTGCGDPDLTADANPPVPANDPSMSAFFKGNPQWHRRSFRIKWIGPNAGIAPGVFGLLEPFFSEKKGVPGIREELGMVDPPACVTLDSPLVDIKTGQAQAIVNGLNVRFDIFRAGAQNQWRTDPRFQPAPNVTKGQMPSNPGQQQRCSPTVVPDDDPDVVPAAKKLTPDKCFDGVTPGCHITAVDINENNPQFDARIGDGKWDIARYFEVNHPEQYETFVGDGDVPVDSDDLTTLLETIRDTPGNTKYDDDPDTNPYCLDDCGVSLDSPPSRFAVYNWELDVNEVPGQQTQHNGEGPDEEGARTNFPTQPDQCADSASINRFRRNIFIAVVNCCEQLEAMSGGDRQVRVDEFLEAFLTEPAAWNGNNTANGQMGAIYIEALKVLAPGATDQVVLRDYVQLY